jgi:nitrate reductase NapD
MNICSALVFADPERLREVQHSIECLDGVEMHHASPDGRMVVTIEDTATSTAVDALRHVATLAGVISASLIYHHFDQDLPNAGRSLELSR